MSEGEYNQGRSMQDIDDSKRYIHGTKAHLRPDTFWADDRYANVTQEDIDAAKIRYAERMKGKQSSGGIYKMPAQSKEYQAILYPKPLYM